MGWVEPEMDGGVQIARRSGQEKGIFEIGCRKGRQSS